jgi:hypothetical protein
VTVSREGPFTDQSGCPWHRDDVEPEARGHPKSNGHGERYSGIHTPEDSASTAAIRKTACGGRSTERSVLTQCYEPGGARNLERPRAATISRIPHNFAAIHPSFRLSRAVSRPRHVVYCRMILLFVTCVQRKFRFRSVVSSSKNVLKFSRVSAPDALDTHARPTVLRPRT